jgi:hypothetical protein
MAVKSRGRGLAAALGLFLLFAGLVGGGVLYIVAQRRPAQTVDGFARAPVGCTTTLDFTETGTFYVFEEVGADAATVGNGCQPVADPSADFEVTFTGELTPSIVDDAETVSYDVDGFDGRSVQRIEITEPGQYTVEVLGDDLTVVAALGRDPDEGVDDLRRSALILAIVGIVLGLLLLTLAGRRSKRAAEVTTPDGPGWGPSQRAGSGDWSPEPPRPGQVPVNPHEPPSRATPERVAPSGASSWQPPSGDAAGDLPAPDPNAPPAPPPVDDPVLPDTPGRVSGT